MGTIVDPVGGTMVDPVGGTMIDRTETRVDPSPQGYTHVVKKM